MLIAAFAPTHCIRSLNVLCSTLNSLSGLSLGSSAAALLLIFRTVLAHCGVFYVEWDCCLFRLDSLSGPGYIVDLCLWCFLHRNTLWSWAPAKCMQTLPFGSHHCFLRHKLFIYTSHQPMSISHVCLVFSSLMKTVLFFLFVGIFLPS